VVKPKSDPVSNFLTTEHSYLWNVGIHCLRVFGYKPLQRLHRFLSGEEYENVTRERFLVVDLEDAFQCRLYEVLRGLLEIYDLDGK
jgi:hypothetical protein